MSVLFASSLSFAQEGEGAPPEVVDPAATAEPTDEGASPEEATPVAEDGDADQKVPSGETSAAGGDGGRFRFGVAGGAGILALSGGGSITMTYSGVDLRFGAQVNDLVGVYVQPQLGAYWGDVGVIAGGGLVGASAVVDFTLSDLFFAGAGFGYGILNNPGGPELHLRGGLYPLLSRSDEKIRRKALMVGVDFRVHIVDAGGTSVTGIAPTLNIGYESF